MRPSGFLPGPTTSSVIPSIDPSCPPSKSRTLVPLGNRVHGLLVEIASYPSKFLSFGMVSRGNAQESIFTIQVEAGTVNPFACIHRSSLTTSQRTSHRALRVLPNRGLQRHSHSLFLLHCASLTVNHGHYPVPRACISPPSVRERFF